MELYIKYFELGTDQYLACIYSIIRLTNWLGKYTSGSIRDYYHTMNERFTALSNSYEIPAERQIELKVKVKGLWDDHEEFKQWFLS